MTGEACDGAAAHRRATAPHRLAGSPVRHAAPGPARVQAGRREGGRRRAGKRRTTDAGKTSGVGEPVAPAKWRQLSYWLIVAGTCVALAIMRLGTHQLKSGTLVLAGVLLIAAIARLALPDLLAGMLSSRRRLLDAAIFAVLGIGLLAAGLGVQAPG